MTVAPIDREYHNHMMSSYGYFMVLWSVFESVLEFTIEREAKLQPLEGTIILSGLGFERKAGITRSLLAIKKKQYEKAISLINQITQEASRNSIVHGIVYIGKRHVKFVKHKTDQCLKTTSRDLDKESFAKLVLTMKNLIDKLQVELGISDDDIILRGKIAESLWNKSPTSPRPPSDTKQS